MRPILQKFRGGIESIDVGQYEGVTISLSKTRTFTRIILRSSKKGFTACGK